MDKTDQTINFSEQIDQMPTLGTDCVGPQFFSLAGKI
jgi:hypothetical protein